MTTTSRPRRWPALLLLFVAGAASAQYKSIGPDGRVTYSDIPPTNARAVNLKPLPTPTDAPALPFELQQAVSRYPVTLYTGDRCAPCDDARTYLRNRGVPFAERTVTSDDDIALFKQQSPDGTAPVVLVGNRRAIGFSPVVVGGLLDAAGYPATSIVPRDYRNADATPLSSATRAPAQAVTRNAPAATGSGAPAATGGAAPAPSAAPGQPGFRF